MEEINSYAMITKKDNIVTNICLWDGKLTTWNPGDEYFMVLLDGSVWCDIGSLYDPDTKTFSWPSE